MKLAPASVQAIIKRAAKAGEAEYLALKNKIRVARLLYIDETSFRVLGRNWWVWVFRSDTDMILIVRNSRGNNVLEEILGKDYVGIVVCDCWRAYIIGAFRSVEGIIVYETLASLIATWQLQKLDIKKELHRMLTTNLC